MASSWQSPRPDICDICHDPLVGEFVDGLVAYGIYHDKWGIMCNACHRKYGAGIGTGKGQRYNHQTLMKVEG